jgi:probable rRNA maturation factor
MTELHVRWMGEEGPTDVLAFPMDELRPPQPGGTQGERDKADASGIPGLLGDVVICPQVAAAQAKQARHGVADEIDLLCAHGILHLLGYDHGDPAEHAAMFGLQDRLLSSWRAEQAELAADQAELAAGEDAVTGAPVTGVPVPGGALPEGAMHEEAVAGEDRAEPTESG